MPRRLEWSPRALADVDRIIDYYTETVSADLAEVAAEFISAAGERIASRPVLHRPGPHNTRECVLRRFPYTIVYRANSRTVRIVRVMHQARQYFNR